MNLIIGFQGKANRDGPPPDRLPPITSEKRCKIGRRRCVRVDTAASQRRVGFLLPTGRPHAGDIQTGVRHIVGSATQM